MKAKNHVRIMLKGVSGSAERHEKATYGSGYNLTLTRYSDDAVLFKSPGIDDARIEIDYIHWYVPHYLIILSFFPSK